MPATGRTNRSSSATETGALPDPAPLRGQYWLTRFVILRLLGVIYGVAFLVLIQQGGPLIGSHGLLPAQDYLETLAAPYAGDRLAAFLAEPTIFWLNCSDATLRLMAYLGFALSLMLLAGFGNAL